MDPASRTSARVPCSVAMCTVSFMRESRFLVSDGSLEKCAGSRLLHVSADISHETRHAQPVRALFYAFRSKWRLYDPAAGKFVDEGDMRIVAEKGGDDTSLRFTVKGHKVKHDDKGWLLRN